MIGRLERSLFDFSPISLRMDFNFFSSRPATPHDNPSSTLTASRTAYLPARVVNEFQLKTIRQHARQREKTNQCLLKPLAPKIITSNRSLAILIEKTETKNISEYIQYQKITLSYNLKFLEMNIQVMKCMYVCVVAIACQIWCVTMTTRNILTPCI